MKLFLAALAAVMFISRMKWNIATLNLLYYMEKNRYKLPSDEDLKECTEFVVKNMVKDLIGS